MSPMSFLYATPSTSTFEAESAFPAEWFSACEISERQWYGMLSLILPASSMNSVEKPNSRAFQVR